MVDPSVKEGIPLAQMVMNCHSEVMCCEVENANLHQWLTEESYKAYEVYYGAWCRWESAAEPTTRRHL